MVSRPASYNSTPGWSTQRVLTRHHRRYGDTPLHWAAERHGLAVCAALLEDGAPVDARSRLLGSRETLLHRLCAAGSADTAAAVPPHAGSGDGGGGGGGAPKPGEDNRTLAELAAMDLNFEVEMTCLVSGLDGITTQRSNRRCSRRWISTLR